jgi:hypothetical protein
MPAAAPATSFQSVVPAANFNWSTATPVQPGISLSRTSGLALGTLTLLITNYTCIDPNDGVTPLANPLSLDLFTNYTLNSAQQASKNLKLDLGSLQLQVPTANKYVLVQAFTDYQSATSLLLASKLVTPAELATLTIAMPDTPATPDPCKP